MSNQQDKHRHHKQPQSFLRGFAYAGTNNYQKVPDIYVYKKGVKYEDGINPSLESIKETGYGTDFYAFKKADGTEDFNTYENILMRDFEQPAQAVLEKVRRLEEIDDNERAIFLRYVASMITRGDWWKEVSEKALASSKISVKQEFLDKFKDKIYKNYTQEELDKIIEDVADSVRNSERGNEGMIRKAKDLTEILKKMNWRFLIAPENLPFLTSDKPVYYFNLDKPESELIFPVSSKITLSLSWKEIISAKKWKKRSKGIWETDHKTVALVRDLICSTAINEVYFCNKVKWLVEFINNRNS